MPEGKLRRSALETFDGCPYRFNVLYNLCLCGHPREDHVGGECCGQTKNPVRGGPKLVPCECDEFRATSDQGDESQRGLAFHEIAFQYIDRLAKAKLTADAEEAELAFQEGIALTQVAPHLIPQVAMLWRRHVESFELDLTAYLSAEERQESDRFTWIPDLVYIYPQKVKIVDWKTYFKGLTLEQAREEFQSRFYLLQALDIWPNFAHYEFEFRFVRLGTSITVTLTPEEIEAFRPEVEAVVLTLNEARRTHNWPAIQGSHCGLCRLVCPLADNPRKLPVRFQTLDDAQEGFGRLLTLEQEVKALKRSLDAWCITEGPLVYRGQEYAHRTNLKSSWPIAAFIDFLRDRGVDESLIDLFMVGRGTLGQFGKKSASPAVKDWLNDHEQAKTIWRFSHRKAGELLEHDDNDATDTGTD